VAADAPPRRRSADDRAGRRGLRPGGGVRSLRAISLAVKLLLELAAIYGLAIGGASFASGLEGVLVAVLAPGAAIAAWAVLAAPRSDRRLPDRARVPFELLVFGLAAIAMGSAAGATAALVFAAVALVDTAMLVVLGDGD
jgi:Protein of unknown function (DUF2568)